jgi:hypothetical protein
MSPHRERVGDFAGQIGQALEAGGGQRAFLPSVCAMCSQGRDHWVAQTGGAGRFRDLITSGGWLFLSSMGMRAVKHLWKIGEALAG